MSWKALKRLDLEKILVSMLIVIGLPTLFYYAERRGGSELTVLHFTVATIYLYTSLMIFFESTLAMFRRYACIENPSGDIKSDPRTPALQRFATRLNRLLKIKSGLQHVRKIVPPAEIPRCSFIIAAYLPNEKEVVFETLDHIINNVKRPDGGMEVIVAYNTPTPLEAEEKLRLYAAQNPEVVIHKVDGSKSKAENVNSALKIVTGKMTCVLDADHHVDPDSFRKAWRWLEHGYDAVQGRNIIRNHGDNLLTKMVAIEFESVYGIAHPAKSFMADTAIFGGSNGFWRTEVLQKICFNPLMLTEDIDASIRTLLSGFRIIHDRSIVATELAPLDFVSFWVQRRRWAQGWFEVTMKYQHRIWRSKYFSTFQKVYWTYLLYYRELFSVISLQIYPIIFSIILLLGYLPLVTHPYLWITTIITLLSGVYQTIATAKVAVPIYPRNYFLIYSVLTWFYATLKNTISVVAMYNVLVGHNAWIVTPRQTAAAAADKKKATMPIGQERLT